MNEAVVPPKTRLDPIKEAQAAAALQASLRQIGEAADEALVMASIEGETSLLETIDQLLLTIAEATGLAQGAQAAAEALGARAARLTRRAEAARSLIEQALMIAELEKLERPTATLSLARRPPKLQVLEEADIPTEFWKRGEPKLDRTALLAVLKDGRAVPGACLANSAPSLTIRSA